MNLVFDPYTGQMVDRRTGLPVAGGAAAPGRANALEQMFNGTGIPERVNALNSLFNPVVALGEAGQHSENMLAPDRAWTQRVSDAGQMLTGMAGTVAPMYAASRGAVPTANAMVDAMTGINLPGGEFLADEFGGLKLYHGSPHDFDKFSMDKIGTGEGAQAYGHGLYFAENEGVARGYRDALAKSGTTGAQRRLQAAGGDIDAAIATATEKAAKYRAGGADSYAEAVEEDLRFLEKFKQTGEWTSGRLYEVEVNANPEDFLDWDAPLSAQPQKVREWFDSRGITPGFAGNQSGAELLLAEKSVLGSEGTTAAMREVGVPGIKYLDHGSRFNSTDGATNTRNYVIFDENLISIVRKYGIAGAAAMLGVSAMDVEQAMAGQR